MYASITDIRTAAADIQRRCRDSGVTVMYDMKAQTAYATPTSVVLPALRPPLTQDDIDLHRYYALHEVGHLKRRDSFALMEEVKPTQEFHGIWNMVEDEAQERESQEDYRGDRTTLIRGRTLHIHRMLTDMRSQNPENLPPDEDSVKRAAAYCVALASRGDWHPGVASLIDPVLTVVGGGVEKLTEELLREGWAKRIGRKLSVTESYEEAKALFERLWPEQPSSQEQEQEGQSEGEGEGEPKDGPPEPGEDEGKEKEKEAGGRVSWEDIIGSHEGFTEGKEPKDGARTIVDYAGWSYDKKVEAYPPSQVTIEKLTHERPFNYSPDMTVANQLRRYIQSVNRDKWETEMRRGRLNKRALKRVVMGTHDYNRKIFQRRTDATAINTAITVLVDASGSMSGHRIATAATGAGILVDSFDHVLRIPVEVLTHTTNMGPEIGIAKDFSDRVNGDTVARRIMGVRKCGNADGDALLVAFDRIRKRSEQRKIIIMLTDGQPTDAYHGDAGSMLHKAIEETRAGGVEVYGIGINHVQADLWFGKDCENVKKVEQLPNAILNTARRFVLKS